MYFLPCGFTGDRGLAGWIDVDRLPSTGQARKVAELINRVHTFVCCLLFDCFRCSGNPRGFRKTHSETNTDVRRRIRTFEHNAPCHSVVRYSPLRMHLQRSCQDFCFSRGNEHKHSCSRFLPMSKIERNET